MVYVSKWHEEQKPKKKKKKRLELKWDVIKISGAGALQPECRNFTLYSRASPMH